MQKRLEENIEIEEILSSCKMDWFMKDPVYFMVACTHDICVTNERDCDVCCGKGRILINPELLPRTDKEYIDDRLKIELIRILLKHPYQRVMPDPGLMYMASTITIGENASFDTVKLPTARETFRDNKYNRLSMEEYYDMLNRDGSACVEGSDPCSSYEDAVEKASDWGDDEVMSVEMNSIIEKFSMLESADSWGSIPGELIDVIKASTIPPYDYSGAFKSFRASVISSSRLLTRMRPSRRFGYKYMGSKRKFTTSVLIAVDTSGSMSSDEIAKGLGIINGFLKYGIEEIDVGCFDYDFYGDEVKSISKKIDGFKIRGRGGTSFDCVLQYVTKCRKRYDGIIIFTDGMAMPPSKKLLERLRGAKILWCINSKSNMKKFLENGAFSNSGKITSILK